jgi:hypothetical protein
MRNLTPAQMLQYTQGLIDNAEDLKKKEVVVGITQENASASVYNSNVTVLQVGTFHEFGTSGLPVRSFLRVPFDLKKDDINEMLDKQLLSVFEDGKDVETALSFVGITAQNISKEAFTTKGYGTWPDIEQGTKDKKGSSQVLIDTGTLRRSITFEVRDKE